MHNVFFRDNLSRHGPWAAEQSIRQFLDQSQRCVTCGTIDPCVPVIRLLEPADCIRERRDRRRRASLAILSARTIGPLKGQ